MALTLLPTFPPGSRGPAIAKLQAYLAQAMGVLLTADGIYGQTTEATVRALQRSAIIPVDGITGPQTWKALSDKLRMSPQISAADIAATTVPQPPPSNKVEVVVPEEPSSAWVALPLLGLLALLATRK